MFRVTEVMRPGRTQVDIKEDLNSALCFAVCVNTCKTRMCTSLQAYTEKDYTGHAKIKLLMHIDEYLPKRHMLFTLKTYSLCRRKTKNNKYHIQVSVAIVSYTMWNIKLVVEQVKNPNIWEEMGIQ